MRLSQRITLSPEIFPAKMQRLMLSLYVNSVLCESAIKGTAFIQDKCILLSHLHYGLISVLSYTPVMPLKDICLLQHFLTIECEGLETSLM